MPIIKKIYSKGFFFPSKRRAVIINFVIQRIFRINADSPWSVNYTSRVICPENIIIKGSSERNLLFSTGCYVQAINGINIGENVWWGANVGIISANHDFRNIENYSGHIESKPIIIEDNVWIGMNSVILPGVHLGKNVVVGAGSVVTKSFSDNLIIAGNPAKIIKHRFKND